MATEVAASPPAWMDGVQVTGAHMRRQIVRSLVGEAGVRTGELVVSALPTPGMAVRLSPGLCFVDDGAGGLYPVHLQLQTDLDIPPAHATLPRIDLVIAQVVDNGDATSTYKFRVVPGTAASTPSPPALPPADASSAKTLAIAEVAVSSTASGSPNIDPGDVDNLAETATSGPRTSHSDLIAAPASMPTTGSYVDFSPAEWPPVSNVQVGPSGILKVTVSVGNLANSASQSSTIRIAYRISGTDTVSASPLDSKCVLAVGQTNSGGTSNPHWVSGSRAKLLTGLTPGGIVTITPQWRISSGSASTVELDDGQLIVEDIL